MALWHAACISLPVHSALTLEDLMLRLLAPALLMLTWMLAATAPAQAEDLGRDGDLCRFQTERQGDLGGLPDNLLTAISHVESGRYDSVREAKTAWPWTVMAEGRGRYFRTKAEAIADVRRLQARGIRNVDVGCMQINLFYHGDAFPDLETAFDPASNVAYAVKFLQDLKRETGAWTTAMTRYHSATPEYARRYKGKIEAELASLGSEPPASVTASGQPGLPLAAAQRDALAKRQAAVASARAEADMQRAAAREFAEKWRARRLAEYQARKEARQADAS